MTEETDGSALGKASAGALIVTAEPAGFESRDAEIFRETQVSSGDVDTVPAVDSMIAVVADATASTAASPTFIALATELDGFDVGGTAE